MTVEIIGEEVQITEPGVPLLSARLGDRAELMALAQLLRETENYEAYYVVDGLVWKHHLIPERQATLLAECLLDDLDDDPDLEDWMTPTQAQTWFDVLAENREAILRYILVGMVIGAALAYVFGRKH